MAEVKHEADYNEAPLREPSDVMRLERMGSFFPTRLSFMRTLMRRLSGEGSKVSRPVFDMDDEGYGRAVYSVDVGGKTYSLVAFSIKLDPNDRTDRVIAEAWDTSYALYDGVPTKEEVDRLEANVPHQEAGRCCAKDLILSRANKSVRLFEHVVDCLSKGEQPDMAQIDEIGYLMRTTAVYGNGKFGIADRTRICEREGLSGPFQAEMLTVWLIRGFTHDLANHVAAKRGGDKAVALSDDIKRHLGIGNSTGLGMAPFLVSHPVLINSWMLVRETALARVRAVDALDAATSQRVLQLAERVTRHLDQWNVVDERQMKRIEVVRGEWADIGPQITLDALAQPYPYEHLLSLAKNGSTECQELMVALVLEPNGDLIDGLEECMATPYDMRLDPSISVGVLCAFIKDKMDWALSLDFEQTKETAQFWYVSEEKLEPRLGLRFEEEGAELEMPLDIARRVQALYRDMEKVDQNQIMAEFLLAHPHHRYAVKRAQTMERFPYSEIQDNLISERCLPIDMLRCKLSFFGASKFDPKSDRWTRITLYQGAPLFHELSTERADDWWLPALETG
ncbi:MAG: hypothetical protein ABJK39_06395 [Hyphomicrobiales bacterium]